MRVGKSKLFKDRKDLDPCFHRGQHGRKARKARAYKRVLEKGCRQRGQREASRWAE